MRIVQMGLPECEAAGVFEVGFGRRRPREVRGTQPLPAPDPSQDPVDLASEEEKLDRVFQQR